MQIGNKLKVYREYRKLSQEELAYKAGINEKYYGRIERNESCPTLEKLQKICEALQIDVVEFFLYNFSCSKNESFFEQHITKIIIEGLKIGIDIHFNRNILIVGCKRCIWYNGYIGSMNFDEFELQLYAVGNIKGSLYLDYKEVLEINGYDVSNELQKYIKNDEELMNLIEFMQVDETILNMKNGNALFIEESNWLSARLINNQKNEVIHSEIIFDDDNILSIFANKEILMDCIFKY